jgi:hypothetical protein
MKVEAFALQDEGADAVLQSPVSRGSNVIIGEVATHLCLGDST